MNGILGTKAPKLGHDGWRAFYTQQHGDNATIVGGRHNDGNDNGNDDGDNDQ